MSISFRGAFGQAGVEYLRNPGQTEGGDGFRAGLNKFSDAQLVALLAMGSWSPQALQDIRDELVARFEARVAEGRAEGDVDKLNELLDKLDDGSISPEEVDELAGMLDVTPSQLGNLKKLDEYLYDEDPGISGG